MKFSIAFFRQTFRFLFLISSLLYSLYSFADAEKQVLRLREGDITDVPGTQTKIVIKSVIDSTSSGCLGGPIGCRDRVTIEIRNGNKSEQVVLDVARTSTQKERKIDQTSIDGKTLRLTSLKKKEVELVLEEPSTGDKDY